MKVIRIENEKPVRCIEAESFPEGVGAAHRQLHAILPFSEERGYYGISWPEQGEIRYLAAAGLLAGDEDRYPGLEKFTIKSGDYLCEIVTGFMENIPAIGQCFQRMLNDPRIDPQGYCLEVYKGSDAHCMVKLKD